MLYSLWIQDDAKAELKRLPGYVRQRVQLAIRDLRNDPRPADSHRMRTPTRLDFELRRLRLDQWRVIYIVDEEFEEIGILAVRRRPPYDYKDLEQLLDSLT